MQLNVKVGEQVVLDIDGHSNINGAALPEGTTIALSSNDPTVATVAPTVDVPAGGAAHIGDIPVTVTGQSGATDILGDITTPDGTKFHAVATLIVEPVVPGLVNVTLTLRSLTPATT